MLFYEKKYPNVDDIVFVSINSFTENGVYCKLLEYNNIEAFLLNTELDKKIYNPKKMFKLTETYPMLVISVVDDKIDLSYKKIAIDSRDSLIDRFHYITKIVWLVKEYHYITKINIDDVCKLSIWKLFNLPLFKNTKELYHNILQDITIFTQYLSLEYPHETQEFIDDIQPRITTTEIVISQKFKLIVLNDDALYILKQLLQYDDDQTIQIKYVASPTYQILASGPNEDQVTKKIEEYVTILKDKIKQFHTVFELLDRTIVKQQEFILKISNLGY